MLGGMLGSMMGGMVGVDPNIMQTIRTDPGLMRALANPKVMIAIQDIMKNKANVGKYQDDEDIMKILERLGSLTGFNFLPVDASNGATAASGPSPPPASAPTPLAVVPRVWQEPEPLALAGAGRTRKAARLPPAAPKVTRVTYDLEDWESLPWYLRTVEIGSHLAQKGFCVVKGGLEPDVRERALLEATQIKLKGGFSRPPREVLCGLFGERGSAYTCDLSDPNGPATHEDEALREIDTYIAAMGMELASCSKSYFNLNIQGRTVGVAHCSKLPEDGVNPPLLDPHEANGYMGLFMRKKLKMIYYAGPSLATMTMTPIGEETQVFKALIPAGAVILVRGDVCRCTLDPKSLELGLTVEVDFLAEQKVGSQEFSRDRVPAPEVLNEWYMTRLQAIVDNDVTEDVPEDLLKLARQTFFKNKPIRVLQVSHNLPTLTLPSEKWRCPIEAASLGGNDCIVEIPMSKWDVGLYYDEDPMKVDDFKMYTKHMGVLDHGFTLSEEKISEFGIAPVEASTIDPRHTLLCESTTLCLQMADMSKEDTKGKNMGIFCGISGNEMYYQFMSREAKLGKFACTQFSNAANVNRLSYLFGSTGPTLVIDTEDSSGCAATDTAAMYVREGRCDFAVAGAVEFIQHPFSIVISCASGTISKTERARVFDDTSDGIIRSEGVVTVLLEMHGSRSKRKSDQEKDEDYEADVRALITGSALNSKGLSSSLTAPSSPAIQDVLRRALKDAQLPGSILDGVEMNASGRALPDTMELSMMKKVLGGTEDPSSTTVALRNVKSIMGDSGPPAGLVSLARACLLLEKAVHGPCIHLNRLFEVGIMSGEDGIDEMSQRALGRMLLPVELMEARNIVQTIGVTSFGSSGTNVHHVLWGRKPDEPNAFAGKPIHWFPTTARTGVEPQVDYYIVGSWSAWERPFLMEPEAEGVYSYTVTLGENRWETFQIWVDGDKDQAIHPVDSWADKDAPVYGPSPNTVCGRFMCWCVNGKPANVRLINMEQAAKLKEEGKTDSVDENHVVVAFQCDYKPEGHENAKDISEMPVIDMNSEMAGEPGDQYLIRLHIHGKYRRVEWTKLSAKIPNKTGPLEEFIHTYYVIGDHNYWTFSKPLQIDPNEKDTYTAEIQMLGSSNRFQVVRDRDWDQIFYPKEGSGADAKIVGPDGAGLDESWQIEGKAGDIYKVNFQRSIAEDSTDKKSISWELIRNEEINFEDMAKEHKYFIVGSWSEFSDMDSMVYKATEHSFTKEILIGPSGSESFQIVLNENWLSIVHPKSSRSSFLDEDHQVEGPDNNGRNSFWVVGKHQNDVVKPGDKIRVILTIDGGLPRHIKWEKIEAETEFTGTGSQSILDVTHERRGE